MPTLIGVGIGVGYGGGVPFTPAALFAGGEAGAWYDPSDLSTLWKDTAGTDPVTADGDAVARQDDKSGNGNHRTQATLGLRPLYKTDGSLHWLLYDGSNDAMATAAIDFTGTADMSVFAGVTKASDAATAMFMELSANADTASNAFYISLPESTSRRIGLFIEGNSPNKAIGILTSNLLQAPVTAVLAAQFSTTATTDAEARSLRVDGADVTLTALLSATLTGNFGNHVLYMGSRGGTSLPFSGKDYGLIVRGAASSAAEIAGAEAYLAGKSGVTL